MMWSRLFGLCYILGQQSSAFVPLSTITAPTTTTTTTTTLFASPIQSVAVIGAGIAGLGVAHGLANDPSITNVQIFDGRPKLDTTAGAGVQLNGGLAALKKINPIAFEAVYQAGIPVQGVQSRTRNNNKTNDNEYDTLLKLDLEQVITKAGGKAVDALIDDNNRLLWISVMRGAIQQALLDTLPATTRRNLAFNKKLVHLHQDESGTICHFSDGSTAGPFDLVIGSDGVQSVCKSFVEKGNTASTKSNNNDKSDDTKNSVAIYSGLRIQYAVQDGASTKSSKTGTNIFNIFAPNKSPQQQKSKTTTTTTRDKVSLSQYFGNGSYGLHGTYGSTGNAPTKCAFLIELDENYIGPFMKRKQQSRKRKPVGENADWSQDVRQEETARQRMLDRVAEANLVPFELVPTIENANRFFELGVYFHNPFSGWSRTTKSNKAVVLCGDAAHALPPFLGQGANQALQDAYCLSNQINKYNNNVGTGASLASYLKKYESTRWPACFNIFWKSAFLGYLETGGENGWYAPFRNLFFKTMATIGVAERVLLSAAVPKLEE